MNLGDNKKVMLGLIEEYSPTTQYLTDDEDIIGLYDVKKAAEWEKNCTKASLSVCWVGISV